MDPRRPGNFTYSDANVCFLYEPFYIGKGCKSRYKSHIYPSYAATDTNIIKQNFLNKIKAQGYNMLDYICIIPFTGSEQSAYIYETTLINSIGMLHNKTGSLTNICNIGGGGPVLLGVKNPNTNVKGVINITNQKKSVTLKNTWREGRFVRKILEHSDNTKLIISKHKKEFWTKDKNKEKHAEKWRKLWNKPGYKESRAARINNNWRVSSLNGDIIDIPNLTHFCNIHNISYEVCRIKFKRGECYKGYTPV
jgi:hypothetical protein